MEGQNATGGDGCAREMTVYVCWKADTPTSAQLYSTNDTLFFVLPCVSSGKKIQPSMIFATPYSLQTHSDDLQHVTIPLPSAQTT